MSARRVLPLILLLAACGDAAPAARPSSPEPSASASAPSVSADALVLAVSTPADGLSLYSLEQGTTEATRLQDLRGPAGFGVQSVSLSGGPSPTTCAVWRPAEGTEESQLHCYAPGDEQGEVVPAGVGAGFVGMRKDGRAVAWTSGSFNQALTVADLSGASPTVRARELYAAGQPEDAGLPGGVNRIDWISDEVLALQHVGDSDEGLGLCFYDLTEPRAADAMGFGRCVPPAKAETAAGYYQYEGAIALADDEVVTVERSRYCCVGEPTGPAARAVRMRPSDGAVLDVVAFPREGRNVTSVSGGARAVVYTTSADGEDVVTSVRWASAMSGAPITGLPAGASVVAQP